MRSRVRCVCGANANDCMCDVSPRQEACVREVTRRAASKQASPVERRLETGAADTAADSPYHILPYFERASLVL